MEAIQITNTNRPPHLEMTETYYQSLLQNMGADSCCFAHRSIGKHSIAKQLNETIEQQTLMKRLN